MEFVSVSRYEDVRVPQRPAAHLAERSLDVVLNPSASHFAFGKHMARERIVAEGSRALGVTYVYANLLGNEAGQAIYDGACLIAQRGELVARSDRLSMAETMITEAVVDIHATRVDQRRQASFTTNPVPPDPGHEVDLIQSASVAAKDWCSIAVSATQWPEAHEKEHAFTRAVALGLWTTSENLTVAALLSL